MLDSADNLLKAMKADVDKILAGDTELQGYLVWVKEKSESVEDSYKLVAIRAFYFSLGCALDRAIKSTPNRNLVLDLDLVRTLDLNLDCTLDLVRDLGVGLDLDLARELDLDLDLVGSFLRPLDRAHSPIRALDLDRALHLVHALDRTGKNDSKLKQSTGNLRSQLPDPKADNKTLEKWWASNGKAWIDELRQVMIERRNIVHDWQFSHSQEEKLQQYYEANQFLVECLNGGCKVTRSARKEIEDTLLLPVAEIEKRKTQ